MASESDAPAGVVTVIGLGGIPELDETDDLGFLLYEAALRAGGLEAGDVVVVAQKAVSKVEGRVVRLDEIEPSERARELAGAEGDPRHVEVILRESREVVRSRPPLVIAETRHGFVCASAGVDASNAPEAGTLVLLPLDPDASARRLRDRLVGLASVEVGVVVSDSFGRAWRQGTTDVALGVAGVAPLRDLRGARDAGGRELQSTQIAVADEIAGAAELVMGKARHHELGRGAVAPRLDAPDDRAGDAPRLAHHELGRAGDLVRDRDLGRLQLTTARVPRAPQVADEIAGAAELVMGKARRVPGAIVRGVETRGDGTAAELVMPRERDLFR